MMQFESEKIEFKSQMLEDLYKEVIAFANTDGGVILLGVEEFRDHSLHPVDLPDPMALVQALMEGLHNPDLVSINLLDESSIIWLEMDGKDIVAIEVPQALPHEKPVYIGRDPYTGTYYRNGEGDYRCPRETVRQLLERAAQTAAAE